MPLEIFEDIPKGLKIRVDQLILPPWARDHHHFVQMNALALESPQVSFTLDQWVDLVFGYKQQDPRAYNCFKELCDEEALARKLQDINEHHVAEIQEFGTNPIKVFREKHPVRERAEYDKKYKHGILVTPQEEATDYFALYCVHQFKLPITFIEAYDSKVFVVLNDRRVHRSREEYLNVLGKHSCSFEKREIMLLPHESILSQGASCFESDPGRCIAFLDQGNYMVTCRHYDHSCKLLATATGDVLQHVFFHTVLQLVIE